jgi:DNA ligase-associated metallophosphoesterase
MNALVIYSINENDFVLSPERTLFWEKQKTLIIADLHIGKTGHFRKSGIPVPQKVFKEDLQRLFTQVLFFKAEQLIIAGDLSHSQSNRELELFKKWRNDLRALKIQLVTGNHDILEDAWYKELNIKRKNKLQIDDFSFYHDPETIEASANEKHYSFCGHLHPSVFMKGRGRQVLELPCFYFKNNYAVLPAFSRFSGMAKILPQPGEHVFAIIENGLVQVQ